MGFNVRHEQKYKSFKSPESFMKRNPLTKREMAAVHEAGHAVVGTFVGINVRCVTIEHEDGMVSFSALGEICDLRRSPPVRVREVTERFIQFAFGGSAAELVKLEQHFGIDNRSQNRASFLCEWQQKLFDENDLDIWYAMRAGDFLVRGDDAKLADELTRLWDRTFRLARSRKLRPYIELLAERLLADDPMPPDELFAMFEQIRQG